MMVWLGVGERHCSGVGGSQPQKHFLGLERPRASLMRWVALDCLDTTHRRQPLLSLGKYLQSIWPVVQEKQKIQRETTLGSHETDPSGKGLHLGLGLCLPQHRGQSLKSS